MRIYFVGVGGTGIGPLALIANKAGYEVYGSDKQDSEYLQYLKGNGLTNIEVSADEEHLSAVHTESPIDWVVTTSAAEKEQSDHPVLRYARENNIKLTKRDEFLSQLIKEKSLKLIAIAGTHGKTTTTAMLVWLFKQLDLPVSYSVGAKLSFGQMGEYDPRAEYFVYECDEYDRNFLSFEPFISVLSGIDYDHPDVFPTREEYYEAFRQFVGQSKATIAWASDAEKLGVQDDKTVITMAQQPLGMASLTLLGDVNRKDARLAIQALAEVTDEDVETLAKIMNVFPGVSRRFEMIAPNIISDYAHTPDKIRGALQLAHEVAGKNVVVVYEGLHNTRQHFIRDDLEHLFDGVKKLYIVPSYRAREDESLEDLTPDKLAELVSEKDKTEPSKLDNKLKSIITKHAQSSDLVLCLTAGGGGSLDEWLRKNYIS
ncbi:MAG: Mur ligase domain-containing protein [bacterium]|nr:Mur ligase domain-containing protein [bacterium]